MIMFQGALTIAFTLLLCSLSAPGAVIFVTDTNDSLKITSLRGAVIAANRAGGNNTIVLGQNLLSQRNPQGARIYNLTIAGADEDASRTGDLDITRGHLTITSSKPNATIDATGLGDRAFQVFQNAQVTLNNVTITGGTAPSGIYVGDGGGGVIVTLGFIAMHGVGHTASADDAAYPSEGEHGGAIFNAGVLSLTGCVITNNRSGTGGNWGANFPGGGGGGIYNSGTLSARNCIIAGNWGGMGATGSEGGNAGGMENDGICTLTDCVISENQSGWGGFSANPHGPGGSGGSGGGIANAGTAVLTRCFIGANAGGPGAEGSVIFSVLYPPATTGGNGGSGAGVYNTGKMHISASTVYGNTTGNGGNDGGNLTTGATGAGGRGGGICNEGTLSVDNSTISGNVCGNGGAVGDNVGYTTGGAGGGGGGIYNQGSLQLTSCTIALNATGTGGKGADASSIYYPYDFPLPAIAAGGAGGSGGGILNDAGAANLSLRNTLLSLNSVNKGGCGGTRNFYPLDRVGAVTNQIGTAGDDGIGFDIGGDFISRGFNLISITNGCTRFHNGVKGDQFGSIATPIDPLLAPLQMNGGQTPTHALLPGSPAIDQGNSFRISTDQRGRRRPHNYTSLPNAPGSDGSDIGAFELQP